MNYQKRRFLRAPLSSVDHSDCNMRFLETENKFVEKQFTKQGWPKLVAITTSGQLTRLNTHDMYGICTPNVTVWAVRVHNIFMCEKTTHWGA